MMHAIHRAAKECDVDALRRELARGVDPDLAMASPCGSTPLQLLPTHPDDWSAEALQCYRVLLENGADVNVCDPANDTVLHDACLNNEAELVALLLEAGANVVLRGWNGNTPLHHAAIHGGVESVLLLLNAGADANACVH